MTTNPTQSTSNSSSAPPSTSPYFYLFPNKQRASENYEYIEEIQSGQNQKSLLDQSPSSTSPSTPSPNPNPTAAVQTSSTSDATVTRWPSERQHRHRHHLFCTGCSLEFNQEVQSSSNKQPKCTATVFNPPIAPNSLINQKQQLDEVGELYIGHKSVEQASSSITEKRPFLFFHAVDRPKRPLLVVIDHKEKDERAIRLLKVHQQNNSGFVHLIDELTGLDATHKCSNIQMLSRYVAAFGIDLSNSLAQQGKIV